MDHSLPWISWQQDFYTVGLSTPHSTPNLEEQASVFVTPRDRVTQLYPQALGTHFSCLLRHAWDTFIYYLFLPTNVAKSSYGIFTTTIQRWWYEHHGVWISLSQYLWPSSSHDGWALAELNLQLENESKIYSKVFKRNKLTANTFGWCFWASCIILMQFSKVIILTVVFLDTSSSLSNTSNLSMPFLLDLKSWQYFLCHDFWN
jgi:hypothetical protein